MLEYHMVKKNLIAAIKELPHVNVIANITVIKLDVGCQTYLKIQLEGRMEEDYK